MKKFNRDGFIYLITNKINNKHYIGQTRRSIEKRWYEHIYTSTYNKRNKVSKLYSAMRKYGQENFTIEEICVCSIEELNKAEEFFIKKFNSINNGYNIHSKASGYSNFRIRNRVYLKYDKNFNLIDIFRTLDQAADSENINISSINRCTLNKVETSGGYLWEVLIDDNDYEELLENWN